MGNGHTPDSDLAQAVRSIQDSAADLGEEIQRGEQIAAQLAGQGDDVDREIQATALGLVDLSPPPPHPRPLSTEGRIRALEDVTGRLLARVGTIERKLAILDDLANPVEVWEAAKTASSSEASATVGQWLTGQDHTLGRLTGIERRLSKLERASDGEETDDSETAAQGIQGFA